MGQKIEGSFWQETFGSWVQARTVNEKDLQWLCAITAWLAPQCNQCRPLETPSTLRLGLLQSTVYNYCSTEVYWRLHQSWEINICILNVIWFNIQCITKLGWNLVLVESKRQIFSNYMTLTQRMTYSGDNKQKTCKIRTSWDCLKYDNSLLEGAEIFNGFF